MDRENTVETVEANQNRPKYKGYEMVIAQRNRLLHACRKAKPALMRYTLDSDLIRLVNEAIAFGELKD